MSKAFTKEDDGNDPDADSPEPSLAGARNYVTPNGLRLLREEFERLRRVERPRIVETVAWAASNGDRSENGDYLHGKKRLREIDRRLRYLLKRLESAELVDPARQTNRDRVFFGARVGYVDDETDGEEKSLRIVGIDEAGAVRGHVSWVSPIARALTRAALGDVVELATPLGVKRLRVTRISYD
jgi:transcription elongation factor GreB